MKKREQYILIKTLDQGSGGVVELVEKRDSGERICRKTIKCRQEPQEAKIMKQLSHSNIVAFIDDDYDEASGMYDLYIEYCEKGSLFDLIEEKKQKRPDQKPYIEEHYIWEVVVQLLAALYVCHYGQQPPSAIVERPEVAPSPLLSRSPKIIHRDIKPKSIFITKAGAVKLGDFGLSQILSVHESNKRKRRSTNVGTSEFMSPELYEGGPYSQKMDTWAFGCTIFELCALQTAYGKPEVKGFGKRGKLPPEYSKELTGFIDQCLTIAPGKRPSIGDLFEQNQVILWTRRSQEWQQRWKQQMQMVEYTEEINRDQLAALDQIKAQETRLHEMKQEPIKHRAAQIQFESSTEKSGIQESFTHRHRSSKISADAVHNLQDVETLMERAIGDAKSKLMFSADHIAISNVIIELKPTWDVLEKFLKQKLKFSDQDREVLIRCRLGTFKKLFGEQQTQIFLFYELKMNKA